MIDIPYKIRLIILFAIALVASMCVYGFIHKIAREKNIVDNPDARKLQKVPVPVMGGVVVFFGIVVGLCFYKTMIVYTSLFPVLGAMIIMLYLGSIDDILSLKPILRLAVEVLVSLLLIYGLKARIADFQGLLGHDIISAAWGIPLSVITFLGIVNAINMIDGVDGLSSGFCILVFGFFGVACFLSHNYSFAVLSAVSIGALLPFFFHNVFGTSSKMFIGDGGTLMMGTAISAMVYVILGKNFSFLGAPELDFSRIGFVVAVLSVPIADTLRVMVVRVAHGVSPFHADNNHMHHLLIRMGCTHIMTTTIELAEDLIAILVLFISWRAGASAGMQLFAVVITAALLNWAMAPVLRLIANRKSAKKESLSR